MEVFTGAFRILGCWIGGLMGKFSSRAPFEVLEDEPLTRALLPQLFGGIVLKQPTVRKSHTKLTSNTSGRRTNLYTEEQGLPEQRSCDGEDTENQLTRKAEVGD